MTPESITNFLTAYIRSLFEETRQVAKGPRWGLDRVVHELALADDLIPVRLSFYRQGDDELARPKKEPEHGVDLSFISADGKRFFVFVLKDEVLSYRNWIAERFEDDLRRARDQDLTTPELIRVEEVSIVLAYNKDDDEEGVESFEKFVRATDPKIAGRAALKFERWNLTTITEKVRAKLLTPSLLPETFFRQLTYLCWQVGDFIHGSAQWREVLTPDWKEFLASVLKSPVTERNVRLVSVALIVLRQYGKRNDDGSLHPSFETGWLELVEWAVLAIWNAVLQVDDDEPKKAALQIWSDFYLGELERFYIDHAECLTTDHGLEAGAGSLNAGASAYRAYWHLGRLGILAMAASEVWVLAEKDVRPKIEEILKRITDWIIGLLNANPACQRPLLDIHHIEIYLVWRALAFLGRDEDIFNWFHDLFRRLLFRRLGRAGCRVIDYGNSWEALFEYLATEEEPYAGFGRSSYLLLMLLELCLGMPERRGEGLLVSIHKQLILGQNSDGTQLQLKESVELMGWAPPEDWHKRILREPVVDGVCLPAQFTNGEGDLAVSVTLRNFIEHSRKAYPFHLPIGGPGSVLVLACIKHVSPLPSEFWRARIFRAKDSAT